MSSTHPLISTDLGGSWQLRDSMSEHSLPATVPGCVHTDLLAAGKIPDPWYRDNEKDIHWVAHRDWIYEREFEVDAELLSRRHVLLRFEGLDTFCTVELNGSVVLEADNMHRTWEVGIKDKLRQGDNVLRLTFHSPLPYMKQRDSERRLPGWNVFHESFYGKSYVRKMACAFGWDWGLMAPTAGIWRSVRLLGFDARIEGVKISQRRKDAKIYLGLSADVFGKGELRFNLLFDGKVVGKSDGYPGEIVVEKPRLWWPNGMGEQPLYELVTELVRADGTVLDTDRRRIGLRTCELVREKDAFGESFKFRVNGRDVFMKGGNWIPCDVFPSRISDATYRHLLDSCAQSNMNMIRVWGGGIYEDDRFYDLCDELGILVWQDFMFACSTYPSFDDNFMRSVEAEARDNVRRLRHRACLALWCGNNEIEQGLVRFDINEWTDYAMPPKDYLALFDELLPKVVDEEDGVTPYWPSSGHTPGQGRHNCWDPTAGDAHSWSVWFGGQSIESQRTWVFRFMSEFGFQSYPELRTVESYTAPDERNLVNWVADYHQRSSNGNQVILKYALDWFREARCFGSSLVISQLIQAICVQYAAEHARRIQGRMDGLLYWQINDLWPGATWSSVDVYGRWKALQYFARRFFAPVLVSLLENHKDGTVAIHVSNHRAEACAVTVKWWVTDCAGKILRKGSTPATVASQCNREVAAIDCQDLREAGGTARLPLEIRGNEAIPMAADRDILVWAIAEENGVELSRNLAFFAKPKYWKLEVPEIEAEVSEEDGHFVVELRPGKCAPWTRLSLPDGDARFSDNYLHLAPHLPARVIVEDTTIENLDDFRGKLRITPLQSL
ncbi:MAG: beta-mannosidase [Oceanipulchritudo sp.]